MITYINKDNADKYRALFAEAAEALQTHDDNFNIVEPGADTAIMRPQETYEVVDITEEEYVAGEYYKKVGSSYVLTAGDEDFDRTATYAIKLVLNGTIGSLAEYFSYIKQLYYINKKFTILPLDEDYFEINANARTITVPKAFATNGIAVQGDEVAEILYFKINRYFDMDDLATKDIYIQWRAPADADGNRTEGVSVPYVIDIETMPGYIIFGWPLASELTQNPGNIEFSVRFYTYDEGVLKYSLSTLIQTATIKQGLNYDIPTIKLDESSVVDSSNLIEDRLENSEVFDPSIPDPEKPSIIKDIIYAIGGHSDWKTDEKGNLYCEVYLTDKKTGKEEDGYYRIQATTTDAGAIAYSWIKKDQEGNYAQTQLIAKTVFIPTEDTGAHDKNKTYYVKVDEDVYKAHVFSSDNQSIEDAKLELGKDKDLYERFSEATLNVTGIVVPGSYQCKVTNRVSRKSSYVLGKIAYIHPPIQPKITKDITESDNGNILKDDNTLTLQVEAEVDPHAYVEYEWFKGDSEDSDYQSIGITKNDTNTYRIVGCSYDETDISENGNGDGWYYVTVSTKLNSVTRTDTSEKMRVTHKASAPKLTASVPTIGDEYNINKPISVILTENKYENRTDEDSYTYTWYRYIGTGNAEQDYQNKHNAAQGLYERRAEDKLLQDVGNTHEITIPQTSANENGQYYCEVTNTYNGTTATICSPFFSIVGDPDISAEYGK